jgi:hypothetical protein
LSGNGNFLTRGNNRNKYWVPLREALHKCQANDDFMLVASAKFEAYVKRGKVAVILAVHGKESIPAKVLSSNGENRLAIVQQGDVGALTLDETYTELLGTLDEGTRVCFGSSGLNEIITGKPLGQFPDGFPFRKMLNEITTGKSAGQFPDGFPFMRIFQEGQVPTDSNSLSELCKAMGTVAEEKLPELQEAGDRLLDLVTEACLDLLPLDVREGVDYRLHSVAKLVVSVRPDISAVEHYAAQVPHTSVTSEKANELTANGIYFFIATIPLTLDGCFLRLYEQFGPDMVPAGTKYPEGKLVFIPPKSMLIVPGGTVQGGGFRTSPLGNRRLQLELFLVPRNHPQLGLQSLLSGRRRQYVGIPEDHPKHYQLMYSYPQYYTDKFKNNKIDALMKELGH